jgi:hypothetical protein
MVVSLGIVEASRKRDRRDKFLEIADGQDVTAKRERNSVKDKKSDVRVLQVEQRLLE